MERGSHEHEQAERDGGHRLELSVKKLVQYNAVMS
jgi:hypothetical protein